MSKLNLSRLVMSNIKAPVRPDTKGRHAAFRKKHADLIQLAKLIWSSSRKYWILNIIIRKWISFYDTSFILLCYPNFIFVTTFKYRSYHRPSIASAKDSLAAFTPTLYMNHAAIKQNTFSKKLFANLIMNLMSKKVIFSFKL